MTTTSEAKAPEGLDVAALLAAPGLTSTLGDRLQAADANGDGVISASEMIDVLQSEADAIRDNKMMKRALIALGVACLLIIAAVVGLTYAVVEMSKDTSVQNNVLVSKDGLQPLSTATLQKTVKLADLYKAEIPSQLDWMEHVTVPFGEGEAVLKIQNTYLVPGQSVRFDTADEGMSVEVTADGVTVSGDEQAPGGRRRLKSYHSGSGSGSDPGGGGDDGCNQYMTYEQWENSRRTVGRRRLMSSNGGRRHLMGGTCLTTVGPRDDYQYDFRKKEFGRCTQRCADYEESDASCISDCDYYL
jgi:hypothetical protein